MKGLEKMIKKILMFCSIFCFSFLLQVKGVCAYEYPEVVYSVKLVESNLGEIEVFFPSNQVQFLSLQEDGTTIINVSSGSVYGYFDYAGNGYRITFPTFDTPYYRLDGSYSNTDLNITELVETNIEFLSDENIFIQNESFYKTIVLFSTVGGVIILCLIWLKR